MFITLTDFDIGIKIYVDIMHISSFYTVKNDTTYLYMAGGQLYTVKESAESIMQSITSLLCSTRGALS